MKKNHQDRRAPAGHTIIMSKVAKQRPVHTLDTVHYRFQLLCINKNDHYFQFKNAYLDFTDDDPETRSYLDVTSLDVESFDESQRKFFMEELIDFKDYYRKYRDLSIIGLIGLYLVNIIDASVDAHLLDFDISDDLSFNIKPYIPSLISPSNFAGLKFSFYF